MGAVVHVSVTTYYSVAVVVVVVESFLYYLPLALSEQLSSCTVIMSSRAARSVGYCRSLPVFPVRGSCLHLIRLTRLSHRVHCQVSSSPFSSQDEFSYLIVSFCFVFCLRNKRNTTVRNSTEHRVAVAMALNRVSAEATVLFFLFLLF